MFKIIVFFVNNTVHPVKYVRTDILLHVEMHHLRKRGGLCL